MCEKVYRGAHTISLSCLWLLLLLFLPIGSLANRIGPLAAFLIRTPSRGPSIIIGDLSLSLSFNNRSFATAFFSILPCRLRCPLGARHPPTAQLWFLIRFISPPSSQTRKRAVLYSTGFAFERIGTSRQILSDPAQPLATIAPHRNKI